MGQFRWLTDRADDLHMSDDEGVEQAAHVVSHRRQNPREDLAGRKRAVPSRAHITKERFQGCTAFVHLHQHIDQVVKPAQAFGVDAERGRLPAHAPERRLELRGHRVRS